MEAKEGGVRRVGEPNYECDGTPASYQRHWRRGEDCPRCRRAWRNLRRLERRQVKKRKIAERPYQGTPGGYYWTLISRRALPPEKVPLKVCQFPYIGFIELDGEKVDSFGGPTVLDAVRTGGRLAWKWNAGRMEGNGDTAT